MGIFTEDLEEIAQHSGSDTFHDREVMLTQLIAKMEEMLNKERENEPELEAADALVDLAHHAGMLEGMQDCIAIVQEALGKL